LRPAGDSPLPIDSKPEERTTTPTTPVKRDQLEAEPCYYRFDSSLDLIHGLGTSHISRLVPYLIR